MNPTRLALPVAIAVALLTAACSAAAPQYRYRPYSVQMDLDPIVDIADVFYEGDMDALREAGARYIGTLEVAGALGSDTPQARFRAELEAARAGGTHIIPTSIGAAHRVTTWTGSPDGADGAAAQRPPGTTQPRTPAPSRGAAYYVLRVPKPALAELPEQLNPRTTPRSSCGIAEIREALLDPPSCVEDLEVGRVDVVIDAEGTVTKLEGVEGSAKECLAHLFGPIRMQPPGREVTCTVHLPVNR